MDRDRKPRWSKWRLIPEWELWEAVALSLNIEPKQVKKKSWNGGLYPSNFAESREFIHRAEILYRIVESGRAAKSGLNLQREPGAKLAATVTPADFMRWLDSSASEWTIPDELEAIADHSQNTDSASGAGSQSNNENSFRRWPWGRHETELLRHLEAAARKWWANYDPDDPTTAPTNEKVVEWLQKERGVSSDRTANAIAKILRADNLPPGRRT